MRVIANPARAVRLMRAIIDDLGLDLSGMVVLTEAASGPFAVTPVIAAMAGAEKVFAVGRTSDWGRFPDVSRHILALSEMAGCSAGIEISDHPPHAYADRSNIVTNLGFVRPIDGELVSRLPADAAVALMWEPWEFRPADVDLAACRARGIPVLGTNEGHPRLRIFSYLARVVEKLLFELDMEVERSRLLLVSSPPFGPAIEAGLSGAGAKVTRFDPTAGQDWKGAAGTLLSAADAVIVAEHRSSDVLIGPRGLSADALAASGARLIHLCGVLDEAALAASGIIKHPRRSVPQGVMTVTTDYVGPRPVIDLHAAGLAVGAALVRELRAGKTEIVARAVVAAEGLGADFGNE